MQNVFINRLFAFTDNIHKVLYKNQPADILDITEG